MMKQFFTTLLCLFFTLSAIAQMPLCEPDPSFQDSMVGVYPQPFDPDESPDGGIDKAACINQDYEFVFTAVVGDTIRFSGFEVAIDSLVLPQDTAIMGLPAGISYACNPPNCSFVRDSIGCVVLFGTPDGTNEPGDYPLEIVGTAYSGFLSVDISFPDQTLFPGEYILELKPEGEDCTSTNTDDILASALTLKAAPNPFRDYTTIQINSTLSRDFQFEVYDLFGQAVHQRSINILEGENTIPFDGSHLAEGIYIYSFSDGLNNVSGKLVINR